MGALSFEPDLEHAKDIHFEFIYIEKWQICNIFLLNSPKKQNSISMSAITLGKYTPRVFRAGLVQEIIFGKSILYIKLYIYIYTL